MKEAYNVLTSYFKRQKYDKLYKQQYNNNLSLFDDSLTTMNNMINPMVSIPKGNNKILQKFMSENQVMMIINEKNVILANSMRDLTKTIIDLLDKELKSIKLN